MNDSDFKFLSSIIGPGGLFDNPDSPFCAPFYNYPCPPVDLYTEGGKVYVKVEIPGVKKDEVNITLDGRVLTISKSTEQVCTKDDNRKFYVCELLDRAFTRTIKIPVPVDAEDITAQYEDGILTISIGKKDYVAPKKVLIP